MTDNTQHVKEYVRCWWINTFSEVNILEGTYVCPKIPRIPRE